MVLYYNHKLKFFSRCLRNTSTEAEKLLWFHIRRKQIKGIQFYRQKPIGNYIVDFYAPKAKLVIEIDGSQHFEEDHKERDKQRDSFLNSLGLSVLRFDNLEVLKNIQGVLGAIYEKLENN